MSENRIMHDRQGFFNRIRTLQMAPAAFRSRMYAAVTAIVSRMLEWRESGAAMKLGRSVREILQGLEGFLDFLGKPVAKKVFALGDLVDPPGQLLDCAALEDVAVDASLHSLGDVVVLAVHG